MKHGWSTDLQVAVLLSVFNLCFIRGFNIRRARDAIFRILCKNVEKDDPADLASVVRVILHYVAIPLVVPPASQERQWSRRHQRGTGGVVQNHGLHRDHRYRGGARLGGALPRVD